MTDNTTGPIRVIDDRSAGYVAECVDLRVVGQGTTKKKALENLIDRLEERREKAARAMRVAERLIVEDFMEQNREALDRGRASAQEWSERNAG